jgi:hypothetical protein
MELLRSALSTSQLYDPEVWPAVMDERAALYNEKLTGLLDRILPQRQFVRRPRPYDPWFDKTCHDAKRLTRRLERAFSAASRRADTAYAASDFSVRTMALGVTNAVVALVVKAAAAKAAWYNQRHSCCQLRRRKCADAGVTIFRLIIVTHGNYGGQ